MMRTIKKLTLSALFLMLVAPGAAIGFADSDGGFKPRVANNDVTNQASLQRGAKYYMNYCLGCHSMEYKRYQRIADDLNLPEDIMLENLAFTGEELSDMVNIAMPPDDAEDWFGLDVPDLTLVGRSRGADWIYNFLHTFYLDENTITGTNNKMLENAAMPHALWSLQGIQKAVYEEDDDGDEVFVGFEIVQEGRMSAQEYDRMVLDIVNFLDYAGEPIQTKRKRIGVWVLIFIGVFTFLSWLLYKEYWRDIKK
ncbi:ubiquinol-cytochrome c reductase cytochrome c1 subunit [Natronospira proteinivora]|uniref:Ubiquinol-cytochrome c reductase cytochrome c1 subunit n=1 Tax=Natronospira proteinivora TaxID=1807133 RepID=A0ABT1G461_9GAMM|nr:cytochrome c1 [Natronospira proteinivora]MCP1726089.1 ubiquinol-cytochrome c reductase cytochrome c1 subunit [Natronospira proteinivora]